MILLQMQCHHLNKHAHALTELFGAFDTLECHGLLLFFLIAP